MTENHFEGSVWEDLRSGFGSTSRTNAWPYEQIMSDLDQYISEQDIAFQAFGPEEIAAFIDQEWVSEYAYSTIDGKISRIANMMTFIWHEDPRVCREKIDVALNDRIDRFDSVTNIRYFTKSERDRTEELIEWLRERRFGTRLHAIVEVMIAAKNRLNGVLRLDLDDVDFEAQEIEVKIHEKCLLSQYDILESRQCALTERAHDALKMYCNRERESPKQDKQAMFTTCHGRVDRSTVYRELDKLSEQLFGDREPPETGRRTLKDGEWESDPITTITPRVLWYYNLDSIRL